MHVQWTKSDTKAIHYMIQLRQQSGREISSAVARVYVLGGD